MKVSGRLVNDLSELKQSKQISSSYIVTNYGDSDQDGNEDPSILSSTYEQTKRVNQRQNSQTNEIEDIENWAKK